MPGTTDTQALPFDYLDEVVSSVPVKNFADAVALKLDAKDTQRTAALKRPAVAARRAATVSVPDATNTVITMDTEVFDTHAMFSTGSNPTRITVPAGAGAGIYYLFGLVGTSGANSTTQVIEFTVRKNGTTMLARRQCLGPVPGIAVTGYASLAVSDYVELVVYQDSTGSLTMSNVEFRVFKVAN